jgi:Mg2+/citrate symporter
MDEDVRFSDRVMGDVKRMIAIMLFTCYKFYGIEKADGLQEKLITLMTREVLQKNVYKIILTVCR